MKFEETLKLLKEGKKVRRTSWNATQYLELDATLGLRKGNSLESFTTKYCMTKNDFVAEDWAEFEHPLLIGDELEYLKIFTHYSSKKLTHIQIFSEWGERYIAFYANCEGIACYMIPIKGSKFNCLKKNHKYALKDFEVYWDTIGQ